MAQKSEDVRGPYVIERGNERGEYHRFKQYERLVTVSSLLRKQSIFLSYPLFFSHIDEDEEQKDELSSHVYITQLRFGE